MRNYAYPGLVAVVLVLFLSGCVWLKSYGQARVLPREDGKATLQQLELNWQDYSIYYTGLSIGAAAGIMFDLKSDGKSLVGDRWIKVEDQETLSRLISVVRSYTQFHPRLSRILGPDNQFYGYLFHALGQPVFKVVDEDTLYAYELKSPVYFGNDGAANGDSK